MPFPGQNAPPRPADSKPNGCWVSTATMAVGLLVVGVLSYHYLKNTFAVPAGLEPFTERTTALAQIKSQTPPPADSVHLTPEWVQFYISSLDSVNKGLANFISMADSMQSENRRARDSSFNSMLSNVSVFKALPMIKPIARYGLAAYLNKTGHSYAEYVWAKNHVLAASGITAGEVQQRINATLAGYFGPTREPRVPLASLTRGDASFQIADSLRRRGYISSADETLVQQYSPLLLEKGMASLMNFETDYSPVTFINQ